MPAPLFYEGLMPLDAGAFELAPVHVENVADAFVRALELPDSIGHTYPLCGPENLTWKQILTRIAGAAGKSKLMLPAPAFAVKLAAGALDSQPWFPITADQIRMLLEGNRCEDNSAFAALGIEPRRFDEQALSYLR